MFYVSIKHAIMCWEGFQLSIGWSEVLVVLFIVLLLFGGKKLPELARSMGRAVQEFKKGIKDE